MDAGPPPEPACGRMPVRWHDSPAPERPLQAGEAELVLAPLWTPPLLMPALVALLAPPERDAAARYATPEAHNRAIVSRAVLRLLLAQHVAVAPERLAIATQANGKPVLSDLDEKRQIAFNVAHAGDLLLVGIAREPIGVDIEAIEPLPDLDAFARIALSVHERERLAATPADRRLAYTYGIWVGKEALVKRSGEGIRRDFAAFDLPVADKNADIAVNIFDPHDGYVAAFASATRTIPRFRRIADMSTILAAYSR